MNEKSKHRLTALAVLSLLLLAATPAAYASTLTVNLNPTTKTAELTSVSSTTIILTYPANSSLSNALKGYHSSSTLSGSFSGGSGAVGILQSRFEDEDSNIRINNMTVSVSTSATANSTALLVDKSTNITASMTGVFSVVNGTVHADLRWKAFSVPGEMALNLQDHSVEVNLVGSAVVDQLSAHPFLAAALVGMFGGDGLWHRPTLNFSSLNTPLSTWTRNYNSLTNTTTFSKTISGESNFHVSADFNGQTYSLSVKSDPSAAVSVEGYAQANGDTLVMQSTPFYLSPILWATGAVLAVIIAGTGILVYRRSRTHPQPQTQTTLPTGPSAQ